MIFVLIVFIITIMHESWPLFQSGHCRHPRPASFSWLYCHFVLVEFSVTGVGLQWSNFNKPVNINNVFTMTDVFIMLLVDIAYLSLITWYFDALLPGDFGTPQPFYFPFTVSDNAQSLFPKIFYLRNYFTKAKKILYTPI